MNTSHEDMVKYLMERWNINPLLIDESGVQIDYGDARIDVSGDIRHAIFDRSRPFYITGTRVTFYVPFTGDADLFKCQPSTWSTNLPRATIRSNKDNYHDFSKPIYRRFRGMEKPVPPVAPMGG